MAKEIIMPKFEMAQETGTVSRWLKNEGDPVEKGEAILEVETDKVNMEVESPAAGILAGITAGPGEVIPIGQVIAYILKPGELLPEKKAAQPATAAPAATMPVTADDAPLRATPLAQRVAESHGVDLESLSLAQPGARITRADVEEAHNRGVNEQAVTISSTDKIRAVPAARRLARELDVDLTIVEGSGPDGRIQSPDVRQAAKLKTKIAPIPTPAAPGEKTIRRQIPFTRMRRIIAERLTASAREAPQFQVSMDVEMSRAMEMVDDLRSTAGPNEPKMTVTAFLVKACAWALQRHPGVNAAFENDAILEWADINIGVAAAVNEGLIVPVIHQVDALGIREIAARLTDLSARAREDQLRPEDVQGGTFTISNLGMFGVDRFTAILNPPEAAILAVSRAAKRPVVTDDDRIEIQLLADFTLTADHRVVDGALAGRFLADLKQAVERPGVLL
ncbi:MAG: hypothetical protein B6243_11915 [Anaerolineaceae bacterium 4572_5.2]|nr:MAG: hypothetical protein B6243_11915 [Anaerolineaceae bacterium 4572_5.2]